MSPVTLPYSQDMPEVIIQTIRSKTCESIAWLKTVKSVENLAHVKFTFTLVRVIDNAVTFAKINGIPVQVSGWYEKSSYDIDSIYPVGYEIRDITRALFSKIIELEDKDPYFLIESIALKVELLTSEMTTICENRWPIY